MTMAEVVSAYQREIMLSVLIITCCGARDARHDTERSRTMWRTFFSRLEAALIDWDAVEAYRTTLTLVGADGKMPCLDAEALRPLLPEALRGLLDDDGK